MESVESYILCVLMRSGLLGFMMDWEYGLGTGELLLLIALPHCTQGFPTCCCSLLAISTWSSNLDFRSGRVRIWDISSGAK